MQSKMLARQPRFSVDKSCGKCPSLHVRPCARRAALFESSSSGIIADERQQPQQQAHDTQHRPVIAQRDVQFLDSRPGYFTVQGRLQLAADPDMVWQVLTAYEACSDVFSNVQSSQVHVRDGNLEVHQKASWSFLAFSGSFDFNLAVDEDAAARRVIFRLIKSSFMRDFEGQWQVSQVQTETGQGQSQPLCLVEHLLSVKPILPVPPPFAYYTRPIFVKQVEGVLQDLETEVSRLQRVATRTMN